MNKTLLVTQYRVSDIKSKVAIVKKLEIEEGDIIKIELPLDKVYSNNAVFIDIINVTKNLVEERYSLVSFSNSVRSSVELEII